MVKSGFDSAHLRSLKDRIEQQKTAKVTKKSITTPVVRVEPTSLKTSTSTPLVRKVAAPGAPETYLGFTTNQGEARVTRKVKRKEEPKLETPPVRKTAPKITTSSWRANAKNAKKMLKKQEKSAPPSEKPRETTDDTKDEEKQEVVDKILSDDVKGILRELQLDVIPQTEAPKTKKPVRISHETAAPAPQPEEEKKRHYKSEEVQEYMQKQKQKRRLEELKRIEDQRINEAKKAREMEKLKDRQLKLQKKRTTQPKPKQNVITKAPFDPYAKALEIIGGVGGGVSKAKSTSSESKSDSLSLEFKPLPSVNIKSPDQTVLLAELDEKINAMTPPPPTPPPAAAAPVPKKKVAFKRPEQTETLLASLRARSRDIDERTQFWSGHLESLKEKQLPGVQLTQQKQQMRQISPIASPPPLPAASAATKDDLIHVEKVEDVVADIVTVERVLKPVSFVQEKNKDELNIVKLMYQKEKERRKLKKRKSKKPPKSESYQSVDNSIMKSDYTSQNASSNPSGDYTSVQEDTQSIIHTQSMDSSISKQQKSSSISSVEHSLISDIQSTALTSTPQPTESIVTVSSPIVTIQPHTESFSNPTAHSTATEEITTESDKSEKMVSSSIATSSESYSKLPTTTATVTTSVVDSEPAAGEQLGQIIHEQLLHNDALDHNLQVVDQMQSARFLDQMRTIQETGRKAAELMLKASKNMARQADVTVTEDTTTTSMVKSEMDVYKTTTAITTSVVSSSINEIKTGPLPDSSEEVGSSSGTITSKIEEETTTKQKTTTVDTVQSKYTDFTEEDEESDFDRSLSMLTPSVAHQKQVKSRKDTSDSSDLEQQQSSSAVDDSFVKFMKKMVSEYAQNKKSSRSKFHLQMSAAKEKAHKDKKRDKGLKKYKNKSYDEKMIKLDATDGSDTSLASSNNNLSASDRVKQWLAKMPNEAALTKREQELHKRRKRAEKLLKWKRRLDEQEKSIIRIEEEANQMAFHVSFIRQSQPKLFD